jgi:single-stranded DNA-binding protein
MNSITIIGTLSDDPARRETRRGVVATFRFAAVGTPRIWIAIESWGLLAERVAQSLAQGRAVAVIASLAYDSSTDHTGLRRERWCVRAQRITSLDPAPSDGVDAPHAGRPERITDHDAGTSDTNPSTTASTVASMPSPAMVIVQ